LKNLFLRPLSTESDHFGSPRVGIFAGSQSERSGDNSGSSMCQAFAKGGDWEGGEGRGFFATMRNEL